MDNKFIQEKEHINKTVENQRKDGDFTNNPWNQENISSTKEKAFQQLKDIAGIAKNNLPEKAKNVIDNSNFSSKVSHSLQSFKAFYKDNTYNNSQFKQPFESYSFFKEMPGIKNIFFNKVT